jgi:hypothetical protein
LQALDTVFAIAANRAGGVADVVDVRTDQLRDDIVWVPKLDSHETNVPEATHTVADPRTSNFRDADGYLVHAYDNTLPLPTVKQAPGFVCGYWGRAADGVEAVSFVLFDDQTAAEGFAARVDTNPRVDSSTGSNPAGSPSPRSS